MASFWLINWRVPDFHHCDLQQEWEILWLLTPTSSFLRPPAQDLKCNLQSRKTRNLWFERKYKKLWFFALSPVWPDQIKIWVCDNATRWKIMRKKWKFCIWSPAWPDQTLLREVSTVEANCSIEPPSPEWKFKDAIFKETLYRIELFHLVSKVQFQCHENFVENTSFDIDI